VLDRVFTSADLADEVATPALCAVPRFKQINFSCKAAKRVFGQIAGSRSRGDYVALGAQPGDA
jgi:hypothetical protein